MTPGEIESEARSLVAHANVTGKWAEIVDRLTALRSMVIRDEQKRIRERCADVHQVYASEVSRGRYRGPLRCPQVELTGQRRSKTIGASRIT